MKICVLQPDYSASTVDYRNYDPTRNLSRLLPGHTVDHVALNKLSTYRQLKQLSKQGYDIFVNLCEGYLDWDIPSIDVIESLERLRLPYTGPTPAMYDPSKPLMKYVAHTVGVRTPMHALLVDDLKDLDTFARGLTFPLFVKPAHAGDSLGVDEHSLVHNAAQLRFKVESIHREYDEVLVEEYVDGRELTVLVLAGIHDEEGAVALTPVEFIFPAGTRFKTYAFKTSELHPEANVPVRDEALAAQLKDAALKVFRAFGGMGYARLDFRMNAAGELFFLDINFTCSVFYADGYEGSADYILKYDPMGQAGFAEHIIAEGRARFQRSQKPYAMRGNAISGYGIFATRDIAAGDVVFWGEGRAQRIVTARHVQTMWNADDQLTFRRYAYPLSEGLFALWDDDSSAWAPQNHSCEPNTAIDGLNVVATRDIAQAEELTTDYGDFLNEESEPFDCSCGAPACRGRIVGTAGNSVAARESARQAAS